MRLSSTWARSSRLAHTRGSPASRSSSRLPAAVAASRHLLTASPATAARSTGPARRVGATRRGRARAGRSTRAVRRSSSASLLRPARPAEPPSAEIASSRSRRPVSGVRSWCDAFATNSRCASMLRSRSAAIWLKERASTRSSSGPSSGRARRDRRARAVSTRRPGGESGDRAAARGATRRAPRRRSRRRRAARAGASSRAPPASTASVPAERRTAPTTRPRSTTGTVTSSRSSPSVSLYLVRVSIRPWKSAARNSGRSSVA